MNLKNNRILVREVLANPSARAVVNREFPGLLSHPLMGMAKNMTLAGVLGQARGRVPQSKIDQVLEELRRI